MRIEKGKKKFAPKLTANTPSTINLGTSTELESTPISRLVTALQTTNTSSLLSPIERVVLGNDLVSIQPPILVCSLSQSLIMNQNKSISSLITVPSNTHSFQQSNISHAFDTNLQEVEEEEDKVEEEQLDVIISKKRVRIVYEDAQDPEELTIAQLIDCKFKTPNDSVMHQQLAERKKIKIQEQGKRKKLAIQAEEAYQKNKNAKVESHLSDNNGDLDQSFSFVEANPDSHLMNEDKSTNDLETINDKSKILHSDEDFIIPEPIADLHTQVIHTAAGPRVRLVNGIVVIDQSSLTIQEDKCVDNVGEDVIIDETLAPHITNASFLKRPRIGKLKWNSELTELFYQGLSYFGTDFYSVTIFMNAFYEPSRFTDLISRKHVKLKFLLEDKKSSNSISYAVLNKKTATPEIYNVMKNFILVKSENNNLILNPIDDDDDDRDDNEDTQIVESVGVIDKAHNNSSTVMIAPMESHNDIDENDPFDMPEPIVEFAKDVNLLAIDSLMAGLNAPPSIDVLTTLPKVAVFKGKRGVSLNLKKK